MSSRETVGAHSASTGRFAAVEGSGRLVGWHLAGAHVLATCLSSPRNRLQRGLKKDGVCASGVSHERGGEAVGATSSLPARANGPLQKCVKLDVPGRAKHRAASAARGLKLGDAKTLAVQQMWHQTPKAQTNGSQIQPLPRSELFLHPPGELPASVWVLRTAFISQSHQDSHGFSLSRASQGTY